MGVGKSQTEATQLASPSEDTSVPEEVDPSKVPADLFGIIFRCKETEVPWRSLLAHAVAIREPLLAIMAACEKVRRTVHEMEEVLESDHWIRWKALPVSLHVTSFDGFNLSPPLTHSGRPHHSAFLHVCVALCQHGPNNS